MSIGGYVLLKTENTRTLTKNLKIKLAVCKDQRRRCGWPTSSKLHESGPFTCLYRKQTLRTPSKEPEAAKREDCQVSQEKATGSYKLHPQL